MEDRYSELWVTRKRSVGGLGGEKASGAKVHNMYGIGEVTAVQYGGEVIGQHQGIATNVF